MVFCIVGTEEGTGGDGARELSTGVDRESVVRRRRTDVIRRLVPLAGGHSIVFLRPTQGCRKDVSVLTHGGYEIIRHFKGHHLFASHQRLCLETPGWRVLDFNGNPLHEDELERQREKIILAPLVVRDREYPFREDLIPDASGNVDPQLPMLAKVLCLVDALQLGGSYELVEKLWDRFVLTASRINVTVAWSRDEVLFSSALSPDSQCPN